MYNNKYYFNCIKKGNSTFFQMFPLFALFPFINLPFVIFDMESLAFGSHKEYLHQFKGKDPDSHVFAEDNIIQTYKVTSNE